MCIRDRIQTDERATEGRGIETLQVLDLLTDTDTVNRQFELLGHRQRDTALGRAVELGHDDTVQTESLVEPVSYTHLRAPR